MQAEQMSFVDAGLLGFFAESEPARPIVAASRVAPERFVPRRSYGACVPRISAFYGITIWMYWNEGAHARPHFHARYAGQTASVDFAGAVIAGSLPRRALALVAEWAVLHEGELAANWERARRDESLEPIDALA
jgi:hypothetical protein